VTGVPRRLVLVKHALPILDPTRPAREWVLGPEGERQAAELADQLRRFLPFRLAASPEPKASRTAGIVAEALDLGVDLDDGLGEIDRPALPIMDRDEHERHNLRLFSEFDRPVIGAESAREAHERFAAAVARTLDKDASRNHVIVAHGTVIALFAAGEDRAQAVTLWKRLQCPSFVVLELPSMRVDEVIERIG
jgi:broad specificity phosphatase PhoE